MSGSSLTLRLAAAASVLAVGAATATTLHQLPKGAHAGECFSHVTTPAIYRTDRIALAQPPLIGWRDVPAVYKTVTKQVLVTPGRVDHENIPAVMGTRIKWIEHPGADHVVEAPPVYRWAERRIMVSPARLVWKHGSVAHGYSAEAYGSGAGYARQSVVNPTGEVMCRVRVPARYEVRRLRVLIAPGRTCIVKGPAIRERIVERFVVSPARTIDHQVAAVYRTDTDHLLITPARREKLVTPQPPRFTEKRVEVTPAHSGWTRIICAPPRARPSRYVAPPVRVVEPVRASPPAHATRPAPRLNYGVQLQPGDQGYGQAPSYTQGQGAVRNYTPDYAPPRPNQLQGAPSQPGYHAPRPGYGQPSY